MTLGIIGAGRWGAALAQGWASAGKECLIWARNAETINAINRDHRLPHTPAIALVPTLRGTADFQDLSAASALVYALPAQQLRPFLATHTLPTGLPLVIVAKGIELTSGHLLHRVAEESGASNPVAILSGPNFASEVIRDLPAATTLACADSRLLEQLQNLLSTPKFRIYPTSDIIGAQVGGAVKNVIAIACGIVEGLKLGENARAALITRGLAEMARLAVTLGGQRETLMGLSGIGDLILTCTSTQSRNYRFGLSLVSGEQMAAAETVEGKHTAPALKTLAAQLNIDMPIAETIARVLAGEIEIAEAVENLLKRQPRSAENV